MSLIWDFTSERVRSVSESSTEAHSMRPGGGRRELAGGMAAC